MITKEICSGQHQAWNLISKVGEGDAGEIYTVESLLDRKAAILKRPRSTAFPSDIIRQAGQIEKEGRILSVLSRLNRPDRLVGVPQLLDQSTPGSEYSERFFIVIERAKGFNLGYVANLIRSGNPQLDLPKNKLPDSSTVASPSEISPMERFYLEELAHAGKIPDFILLRMLIGLIEFLEEIHLLEINTPSAEYFGVLWNDVKLEHLFWDANEPHLTIVDWGNGQFLQADGTTSDRTLSRMSDHFQLVTEMGRFLEYSAPDFYTQLDWPTSITTSNAYSAGILPLKERLSDLLRNEIISLSHIHQEEKNILQDPKPEYEKYLQLAEIHRRLLEFGELPDYAGAEKFLLSMANDLIEKGELERFRELCSRAKDHPILEGEKFHLLERIAEVTLEHGTPVDALQFGLNDDWISSLWELRLFALSSPESAGWDELSKMIRCFSLGSETISPFVALNRLIHALHTYLLDEELLNEKKAHKSQGKSKIDLSGLYQKLKDEILPRWTNLEPDPPDSGLEYHDVEGFFEQIVNSIPQAGEAFLKSLAQPQAQVKITMDAWERMDFSTARRSLRWVLLWDPDRLRVITTDLALKVAQTWLEEVQAGLKKDEPLQDFITRMELTGREIRNQVGPATWLDSLLDAFKQLRKGDEPTDVLMEHPDIREEISWLISLEPRRPLLSSSGKPVLLERKIVPKYQRPTLYGIKNSSISSEAELSLNGPLDTWVPEAKGSSARVFSGSLAGLAGESHSAAVKIMRHNRIEYALPLFLEEARILTLLQDIPGVTPLLECGFIQLDENQQIPPEEKRYSAQDLTGIVQRYGLDSVHNFLTDLENKVGTGWLPYLAIEKQEKADNLLLLCDTGYTRGHFIPILEGLRAGIQICDILEAAHARNITFRDHKILHYYWQEAYNGIFVIDWNIARRYPEGAPDTEIQFDLVQFGARTLHYILTGRPAPGALPMGPNRPEEIDAAARSYSAHWTYDDQRLPGDIKELLEALLAGGYKSARQLREDLHSIFTSLSELV